MWEEGGRREEDRPTKPLPGHQEVSRDHLAPLPLGPAHPGQVLVLSACICPGTGCSLPSGTNSLAFEKIFCAPSWNLTVSRCWRHGLICSIRHTTIPVCPQLLSSELITSSSVSHPPHHGFPALGTPLRE